tara:strand:- start:4481 stop:4651 length:171 start_codon:yes stop_codon:yes gene_type:complete
MAYCDGELPKGVGEKKISLKEGFEDFANFMGVDEQHTENLINFLVTRGVDLSRHIK